MKHQSVGITVNHNMTRLQIDSIDQMESTRHCSPLQQVCLGKFCFLFSLFCSPSCSQQNMNLTVWGIKQVMGSSPSSSPAEHHSFVRQIHLRDSCFSADVNLTTQSIVRDCRFMLCSRIQAAHTCAIQVTIMSLIDQPYNYFREQVAYQQGIVALFDRAASRRTPASQQQLLLLHDPVEVLHMLNEMFPHRSVQSCYGNHQAQPKSSVRTIAITCNLTSCQNGRCV